MIIVIAETERHQDNATGPTTHWPPQEAEEAYLDKAQVTTFQPHQKLNPFTVTRVDLKATLQKHTVRDEPG